MPDVVIRSILPAASAAKPAHPRPTGFHCEYLWDSVTVLSDGNVTCGFDDPFGTRSFGNIRTSSIRDIFNSAGVRQLRQKLLSGSRCETCHLYRRVGAADAGDPPAIPEYPRRLILETTIRCNLRCRNTSCDLNNDRGFKVRKESYLDFDLYRRLIDELGPHLGAMYFFNYGEPFLHPRAVDMLAYAKDVNPSIHVATSTNGILLCRGDAAARIVAEGLVDWMNFTIAGCDDASYQRYHHGGSFEEAFEGMRRVLVERRRLGKELPRVRWRYLLFNWNDSDEQVAQARALAREIGVDEFTFFLCSAPLEGRSRLRAPGQPGFEAIADAIDYEVHYQADPFADSGLYAPEHDRELGAYCWTSRKATLDVGPSRGRVVLHLARPISMRGEAPAARLVTPWGERPAEFAIGQWAANEIEIPEEWAAKAFCVEVHVDPIFIPFRHGTRDDTRELGLMLSLAFFEHGAACVPFRFANAVDAPPGRWIVSTGIVAGGVAEGASICVSGGEYAVGRSAFTTAAGVVQNGQTVRVRHRASSRKGRRITTTLSVGTYSTTFTSIAGTEALAGIHDEYARPTPIPQGHILDDPRRFVMQQYEDLLGRSADPGGMEWWMNAVIAHQDHAAVAEGLLGSEEFEQKIAPVVRLYMACFPRIPDYEGVQHWLARSRSGQSLDAIARTLVSLGEFAARFAALDDEHFLERIHQEMLGRPPTAADCEAWAGKDRDQVMLGIAEREDYRLGASNRVFTAMAYIGLVARTPDVVGFSYWVDHLNDGGSRHGLVNALLRSPEYADRFQPPVPEEDRSMEDRLVSQLVVASVRGLEIAGVRNTWATPISGALRPRS